MVTVGKVLGSVNLGLAPLPSETALLKGPKETGVHDSSDEHTILMHLHRLLEGQRVAYPLCDAILCDSNVCDTVCDQVCDVVCDNVCDAICDTICDKICDVICDKVCDANR